MLQSDSPLGEILTCPWCHRRQRSLMTGLCRCCRRPLPVTYVELRIPPIPAQADPLEADSLSRFIGKSLRRLRLRRGCTQSTLARALGTHRTHVSRIENGRVMSTAGFALRAAAALGVARIIVCARTQELREPIENA